jgi:hypothetical protein
VPLTAAKRNGKGVQKSDILDSSQDIMIDGLLSASQEALDELLIEDSKNKAEIRQKDDTLIFVRVVHVLHLTAES